MSSIIDMMLVMKKSYQELLDFSNELDSQFELKVIDYSI